MKKRIAMVSCFCIDIRMGQLTRDPHFREDRSRRTGSEASAFGRNFNATGCPNFRSSAR